MTEFVDSLNKVIGINVTYYKGIRIDCTGGKYIVGDYAMKRTYDTMQQAKASIEEGYKALSRQSKSYAAERINNDILGEDNDGIDYHVRYWLDNGE